MIIVMYNYIYFSFCTKTFLLFYNALFVCVVYLFCCFRSFYNFLKVLIVVPVTIWFFRECLLFVCIVVYALKFSFYKNCYCIIVYIYFFLVFILVFKKLFSNRHIGSSRMLVYVVYVVCLFRLLLFIWFLRFTFKFSCLLLFVGDITWRTFVCFVRSCCVLFVHK